MARRAVVHAFALGVLFGGSPLLAQALTPDFRVSAATTDSESEPAIAPIADQGYVVVWQDRHDEVAHFTTHVWAQRIDLESNLLGAAFRVSPGTTGAEHSPSIASDAAGNFVVVWTDALNVHGSVFGQRYAPDLTPLGDNFRVTNSTTTDHLAPTVAVDASGAYFVVTWEVYDVAAGAYGIFGRRYSGSGDSLGGVFRVDQSTTGVFIGPRVSAAKDKFVVVWRGPLGDPDAHGRLYNANGNPLTGDFVVNSFTTGYQGAPDVAMLTDQSFVVAWTAKDPPNGYDVHFRRFDATGTPIGLGFRVNSYTTDDQSDPRIALDAHGHFIVVWASANQDGDQFGIFGQRLDDTGAPVGSEFRVNEITTGRQVAPSIAASHKADDFTVVWMTSNASGYDTWGRAFTLIGDANGDGIQDVGDVFYLINHLFAGGPAPLASSDVNHDGHLDIADVFYLINYLFAGGPPPG